MLTSSSIFFCYFVHLLGNAQAKLKDRTILSLNNRIISVLSYFNLFLHRNVGNQGCNTFQAYSIFVIDLKEIHANCNFSTYLELFKIIQNQVTYFIRISAKSEKIINYSLLVMTIRNSLINKKNSSEANKRRKIMQASVDCFELL